MSPIPTPRRRSAISGLSFRLYLCLPRSQTQAYMTRLPPITAVKVDHCGYLYVLRGRRALRSANRWQSLYPTDSSSMERPCVRDLAKGKWDTTGLQAHQPPAGIDISMRLVNAHFRLFCAGGALKCGRWVLFSCKSQGRIYHVPRKLPLSNIDSAG